MTFLAGLWTGAIGGMVLMAIMTAGKVEDLHREIERLKPKTNGHREADVIRLADYGDRQAQYHHTPREGA